jgi:hypothetical protein
MHLSLKWENKRFGLVIRQLKNFTNIQFLLSHDRWTVQEGMLSAVKRAPIRMVVVYN